MKFDATEIRRRITVAPKHFTIPAALLAAVILLATARLAFTAHDSNTTHAPVATTTAPTPATSAMPAPSAAVEKSAEQRVGSTAEPTPAPTNATMQDPLSPSIPEPAGLVEMRALYTLESAARPDNDQAVQWSEIGHKVISSNAANFGALKVKDLSDLLPSRGLARETWAFWANVPTGGDWVTALRAQGAYYSTVSVEVDGRPVSNLAAEPKDRQVTQVATLRLAAGWHKIAITFGQFIQPNRADMTANVQLFWRGPGDDQPVAIVPGAVDTTTAPASAGATSAKAPAPAAASTAAPTSAQTSAEAKP